MFINAYFNMLLFPQNEIRKSLLNSTVTYKKYKSFDVTKLFDVFD